MLYVAVDIGCIECDEDSAVLGVFTNEEKAEEACNDHKARLELSLRGEHMFQVFPINQMDEEHRVNY